jgi:hypothetical protein
MNYFLDLTKKKLGLKLKKKLGLKFFFGPYKMGALGECLTRLGFEPALVYSIIRLGVESEYYSNTLRELRGLTL